jgi:hypothetical protein
MVKCYLNHQSRTSRRRTPEPGGGEGVRRAPIIWLESCLLRRSTKDQFTLVSSKFTDYTWYPEISACALVVVASATGSFLKSRNVLNLDYQLR